MPSLRLKSLRISGVRASKSHATSDEGISLPNNKPRSFRIGFNRIANLSSSLKWKLKWEGERGGPGGERRPDPHRCAGAAARQRKSRGRAGGA